jgi:serine/threonine-protein kinase
MSDTLPRLNTALDGRYRIESELGRGGMATVYRARDLRHNRQVALKVLDPELAAVVGAARFLGEIETTANLQHPHILPLYDSGEADGFLFYVMPLLEGESLRDRLDRDRQLPVEEAVRITAAVATALDYAHQRGVVHRDIKPANILFQGGQPVVGDFGIALALGASAGARLTETGLSVGTPYYMSPEQATGEASVGPAADTFSLGCVLYEMLAGQPPYSGSTAQAVLGRIISAEPVSVRDERPTVPANVDAAIRKCLERVPADRFANLGDLVRALEDPGFRHGPEAPGATAPARVNRGLAVLSVLLAAALGWSLLSSDGAPSDAPLEVFSLEIPPARDPQSSIDISDDGSIFVMSQPGADDAVELWVRRRDELEWTPLAGTDPGAAAAISPDGTEILFFAGGQEAGRLQFTQVEGGPVRELAPARMTKPDWGSDGQVYFGAPGGGLARIPRQGGDAEPLTTPEEGTVHLYPLVLPGSRWLLYTVAGRGPTRIEALDLSSGEVHHVLNGAGANLTSNGYLVYGADGGLMAVPFDAGTARATGTPVAVIPDVVQTGIGRPFYAISSTGTLLYWTGTFAEDEFVWLDRTGVARPVEPGWTFDAGNADRGWRLSPDGGRLAYRAWTEAGYDIWVKEIGGAPPARFTFHEAEDRQPRWSSDGTMISFVSNRTGTYAAWQKPADGLGDAELVFEPQDGFLAQGFWSLDGEHLVMRAGGFRNTQGGRDITAIRPGRDSVMFPVAAGPAEETGPELSRDSRWIAYVSTETGQEEVFVRPFPDVGRGRWQISTGGGTMPLWAHNGRELFYVDGDHRLISVTYDASSGFRVANRQVLFQIGSSFESNLYRWIGGLYDVTPDDQRFLMVRRHERTDESKPRLIVVQNWFEELERRVPR